MNSLQLGILLIVLAVLITVIALLVASRQQHHKRHTGVVHRAKKEVLEKGHGALKKLDHGAAVAIEHGLKRSPHWARVEMEHLLREPACVVCGHKGHGVQVHHIKPFHLHPDLELDQHNLITLCEVPGREHHLLLGHLDDWKSYNEHIRADAKHYYRKSAAQIRADLIWQKKMSLRPYLTLEEIKKKIK